MSDIGTALHLQISFHKHALVGHQRYFCIIVSASMNHITTQSAICCKFTCYHSITLPAPNNNPHHQPLSSSLITLVPITSPYWHLFPLPCPIHDNFPNLSISAAGQLQSSETPQARLANGTPECRRQHFLKQ
jgi:hypothetical protein